MEEQRSQENANNQSSEMIGQAIKEYTQEMARGRRWTNGLRLVKFSIWAIVIMLFFGLMAAGQKSQSVASFGDHTAVVKVEGVIAAGADASADLLNKALRNAFKHPNTKQVVLKVNSPGGSPVQSEYVFQEIKRLKALNPEIQVIAVISDTGASGAYYISAAADEIYAAPASLVGSIGVTAVNFGFTEAIEKLGIERRSYTSGEHKAFLDPFMPQKADETALFEALLKNVHDQFINRVKEGRGDKLVDDPKLFSGLFWSGEQALELGLIDGLKSAEDVARDNGYESMVDFTIKPDPFEEFAKQLGVSIGQGGLESIGNVTLK